MMHGRKSGSLMPVSCQSELINRLLLPRGSSRIRRCCFQDFCPVHFADRAQTPCFTVALGTFDIRIHLRLVINKKLVRHDAFLRYWDKVVFRLTPDSLSHPYGHPISDGSFLLVRQAGHMP